MRLAECIRKAIKLGLFPKERLNNMCEVQMFFFNRMMCLEARVMHLKHVPIETLRQAELTEHNALESLLGEKREVPKKKLTFTKEIKVVKYELAEGARFKRKTQRRWSNSEITDPLFQGLHEGLENISLSSDIDEPYPTATMDMNENKTTCLQRTPFSIVSTSTTTPSTFIKNNNTGKTLQGGLKPHKTHSSDHHSEERGEDASEPGIEESKVIQPISARLSNNKDESHLMFPLSSLSLGGRTSGHVSNLAINGNQQDRQYSSPTSGDPTRSELQSK